MGAGLRRGERLHLHPRRPGIPKLICLVVVLASQFAILACSGGDSAPAAQPTAAHVPQATTAPTATETPHAEPIPTPTLGLEPQQAAETGTLQSASATAPMPAPTAGSELVAPETAQPSASPAGETLDHSQPRWDLHRCWDFMNEPPPGIPYPTQCQEILPLEVIGQHDETYRELLPSPDSGGSSAE